MDSNLSAFFKKACIGYTRIGKGVILLSSVIIATAVFVFVFVLPLWSFAHNAPEHFTMTMLLLLLAGLIWVIISRIRRGIQDFDGNRSTYLTKRFLPRLQKLGIILGFIVAPYGIALLYVNFHPAYGGVSTAVYLLALGVLIHGGSRE